MEKHMNILGGLYIAFGMLGVFAALVVFVAVIGSGLISQDSEAIFITTTVASVIASFLFILSAPGIIGGFGLLKWQSWARILVLVLGFLNLVNFPFGTALGIYTIWVLMKPETEQLFREHQT
ncbi:MAG TPA: hypothetical protein ENK14_09020 [Caldithrix sp.]|nr:hypothetical protein [Caldithrix sp.]